MKICLIFLNYKEIRKRKKIKKEIKIEKNWNIKYSLKVFYFAISKKKSVEKLNIIFSAFMIIQKGYTQNYKNKVKNTKKN